MRNLLPILLAAAAVLFTGCFEIEDTLTVNADGSGHWKFRMKLGPKMTAMVATKKDSITFGGDIMTEEKKLREAIKQIKGARLISFSTKQADGELTTKVEIAFDSIVELYRSPRFKEQLNWEFRKVGGRLEATIKTGILGEDGDDDVTKQMEFSALKAGMSGLKIDRTLVLPNQVISANGKEKSGKRARWFVELTTDTTEEAWKKHRKVKPIATCSAAGVTFKLPLGPVGSIPVDLTQFSTDDEGMKAQLAEVTIKPMQGRTMRNANYSDTKVFFSSAPLTVTTEISWPKGLKPAGWSQLTITEGSDSTGRKLTLHGKPDAEKVHELRPRFNKENVSKIDVPLSEPDRLAETFSAKGAILLHVPASLKTVEIPNISKLVGKTLDHPDLKQFGLKVKSTSRANVQLAGDNPNDAIVDLKMVNPDDDTHVMKRFYLNRNKFRDEHRLQAGFSMGRKPINNPTLVITVAGKIDKYAVPFEFTDLKAP
ncbi:MAG: hypothetical protein ACPGVU_06025 [Limisphaerales bacterium]